jgi:3-(3-hydroxy-phenyl)propionate hydroxylase
LSNKDRIIIAGAGPVGLSAACILAERGIPVTVLEAEASLPQNLRASTFHPSTLDLLSRFGASERLIEMGLKAPTLQYRDRSGWHVQFDFSLIKDHTQYPFRVQCEQYKVNGVLLDWLRANSPETEVRFSTKVVGVTQTDDQVTVTVETPNGREEISGRYLLGADGARSAVRENIGMILEGFTWPERFLVVTTPVDFSKYIDNLSSVSYFGDPEQWFFLLRVGSHWRVMFQTKPEESDEHLLSEESIQANLQRVLPRDEKYQVDHRTLYGVHQRIAPSYRKGRVFLAGDAAHINNPLGGMGMNGGIHDAFNIADKLARVCLGEADESELDRYERQRRPIAVEYVDKITIQNKKDLEISDPDERARYRAKMEETANDPEKAREFLLRASMIASLQKAAGLA